MEYLLGKEIVELIKEQLSEKIKSFRRKPKYCILLNKNDSSSLGYVRSQVKLANELGIETEVIMMNDSENEYISLINKLNEEKTVDGILITRPLFKGADEKKILSYLSPYKDIDAANPLALGKIFMDDYSLFAPATAEAVIRMIEHYNIEVSGKEVLVIGRSISVGKPAAMLLLRKNATIKIAHTKTQNLDKAISEADVIIVAVGKPQLIDTSKMKEDAIVIDCGIHYLESGIVGDVKISKNVSKISKVPGGIGPITSVLLMEHVVKCYEVNNND